MCKNNGKKIKVRSLQRQITFTFLGVLLLSIFTITVINYFFLEKYYMSKKIECLLKAEKEISKLDMDEHMETECYSADSIENHLPEELARESSQNNLSWVVITKDNTAFIHWGENTTLLRNKLFGYAYHLNSSDDGINIIKKNNDFIVQQVKDNYVGMDYVECWGVLPNGNYFLIRTPLESIRESAEISNSFYFAVGLVILLISGFVIWMITRKITKPICELTGLAQKMSNLEFEAKYNSHTGNEIDLLGHSFNRMSTELEATISQLKSANTQLVQDIAKKIEIDEMRKEFLDNVSHELKTPIALIQGYAEGLRDNILEDPESREFYCDVIIDESAKMNKLVKNLLTLNQLESGNDELTMERFDIVALIKGVIQSLNIMISKAEANVIFNNEDSIHVWADEFKIEEVVTNYLSNAIHHLGGEKKIIIKVISENEKAFISVFNTGSPIPEEDIPNLWTKFYKVDKARTREYGGSGIGLSIVKAILDGHGQDYGVKNYDNGVEFYFTLDEK